MQVHPTTVDTSGINHEINSLVFLGGFDADTLYHQPNELLNELYGAEGIDDKLELAREFDDIPF